jgi:cobalt/nickel transport protein
MKAWNLLLAAAVVALVAMSLLLPRAGVEENAFTGTDDQAKDTIQEVHPGYVPWFKPVWKPPSEEVATLLFTVQAALGAGVLGYVIGYFRGRAGKREQVDGRD